MLLRYSGKPTAPSESLSAAAGELAGETALRTREWVYLPDAELVEAVNIALLLEQPLLVTGDPGTGKTKLADAVARDLKLGEVLRFDTKSTSTFRDLFYRFDSLRSFRDAQNSVPNKISLDYIDYTALGKAILLANPKQKVEKYIRGLVHAGDPMRSLVLIDEVDKAPRDFPNDLLRELEEMYFSVPELDVDFKADSQFRPVVIITSNSERQLPEAFLRRCVYYHILFPKPERLKDIVSERLGEGFPRNGRLLEETVNLFYKLRSDDLSLHRKPSTAELLNWIVTLRHLLGNSGVSLSEYTKSVVGSLCCVVKDPEDRDKAAQRVQEWLK